MYARLARHCRFAPPHCRQRVWHRLAGAGGEGLSPCNTLEGFLGRFGSSGQFGVSEVQILTPGAHGPVSSRRKQMGVSARAVARGSHHVASEFCASCSTSAQCRWHRGFDKSVRRRSGKKPRGTSPTITCSTPRRVPWAGRGAGRGPERGGTGGTQGFRRRKSSLVSSGSWGVWGQRGRMLVGRKSRGRCASLEGEAGTLGNASARAVEPRLRGGEARPGGGARPH